MSRPKHTTGKIKNIGPRSQQWLESIGINTIEDVANRGSVQTYLELKKTIPGISILMLYALEAALWDLHWNDLPVELKNSLHEQIGYEPPGLKRKGKT